MPLVNMLCYIVSTTCTKMVKFFFLSSYFLNSTLVQVVNYETLMWRAAMMRTGPNDASGVIWALRVSIFFSFVLLY